MEIEALFMQAVFAQARTDTVRKAVEWMEEDWFASALWKATLVAAKDVLATGRPCTRENVLGSFPWSDTQIQFIKGLDLGLGEGVELRLLAKTLRDEHRSKRFYQSMSDLGRLTGDPKTLIDAALQKIGDLALSMNEDRFQIKNLQDAMLFAQNNPLVPLDRTINVVHTGIYPIDSAVRMVRRSMGVIAAITSAGKSTLAVQMASCSALAGKSSLIVSLEMEHEEVQAKAMSYYVRKDAWDILTGADKPKFNQEQLDAGKLIDTLACGSGTPWPPIESAIRARHKSKKLDCVFVDYLTLLDPPQHGKSANLAQRFGELSKSMRRLAQELDICVVMVCQFNRNAEEGNEPMLNQLRETGQIENDCNWAILLWNVDKASGKTKDVRDVKFKIAKNRGGKRNIEGTLKFDPKFNIFGEKEC